MFVIFIKLITSVISDGEPFDAFRPAVWFRSNCNRMKVVTLSSWFQGF